MEQQVIVERRVHAPRDVVYRYLTESDKWARWQGIAASLDARVGGTFSMTMPNGLRAAGHFVELVQDERVVFTWGWVDHPGLPSGSSTVEITLTDDGNHTMVRLVHGGLPHDEIAIHQTGWDHYLPRLAAAVAGVDPGPDTGPA